MRRGWMEDDLPSPSPVEYTRLREIERIKERVEGRTHNGHFCFHLRITKLARPPGSLLSFTSLLLSGKVFLSLSFTSLLLPGRVFFLSLSRFRPETNLSLSCLLSKSCFPPISFGIQSLEFDNRGLRLRY